MNRISVGSALARMAYGALIDAAREMRAEGSFGFAGRAIGSGELSQLLAAGR